MNALFNYALTETFNHNGFMTISITVAFFGYCLIKSIYMVF